MANLQLDQIDISILEELQKDSTISIKELAARVGLTPTPTYERVKYLEEQGLVKKYVAILDLKKLGVGIQVYCNVTLKEQSKKALLDFEKEISKMPEVLEIISLSGQYDYMLRIIAKDITSYNEFVMNRLSNIKNMGMYHSHIVLSVPKQETALPVRLLVGE